MSQPRDSFWLDEGPLSLSLYCEDSAVLRYFRFWGADQVDPNAPLLTWEITITRPLEDQAVYETALEGRFNMLEMWDDHLVLLHDCDDEQQILRGESVVLETVEPTRSELIHATSAYNAQFRNAHAQSSRLSQKRAELTSLTRELLRRAELKSGISDHHAERQASAIKVLQRILRHLGS